MPPRLPESQTHLTKRMEFLAKEDFSTLDPQIFSQETRHKKKKAGKGKAAKRHH